MDDRSSWSRAVQWGVWLVVMSLVMGWLAKARKPATVVGRANVLTHPPTTLIVGIVCTSLFALATILAGVFAKPDEWWTPYCFLGFTLASSSLIGDALRVRHELGDEGIVYQGLFTRYDRVSWEEIASAHWSASMKWLALTTRDGRVLRFSAMISGLDSLARALGEHVPQVDADVATAQVLADARAGKLPSIWM